MEQEIETKFDVPSEVSEKELLPKLEKIIEEQKYLCVSRTQETRHFQYYDTPDLDLYQRGETLRKVSGFNPKKHPALFRYDLKIGQLDNRYEDNKWLNKELSPEQLRDLFHLAAIYANLSPSAAASTSHFKINIQRDNTKVEVSLDYFAVEEGTPFCELELELKAGNQTNLFDFSQRVQEELRLTPLDKQKYSRVIESMRKYKLFYSTS